MTIRKTIATGLAVSGLLLGSPLAEAARGDGERYEPRPAGRCGTPHLRDDYTPEGVNLRTGCVRQPLLLSNLDVDSRFGSFLGGLEAASQGLPLGWFFAEGRARAPGAGDRDAVTETVGKFWRGTFDMEIYELRACEGAESPCAVVLLTPYGTDHVFVRTAESAPYLLPYDGETVVDFDPGAADPNLNANPPEGIPANPDLPLSKRTGSVSQVDPPSFLRGYHVSVHGAGANKYYRLTRNDGIQADLKQHGTYAAGYPRFLLEEVRAYGGPAAPGEHTPGTSLIPKATLTVVRDTDHRVTIVRNQRYPTPRRSSEMPRNTTTPEPAASWASDIYTFSYDAGYLTRAWNRPRNFHYDFSGNGGTLRIEIPRPNGMANQRTDIVFSLNANGTVDEVGYDNWATFLHFERNNALLVEKVEDYRDGTPITTRNFSWTNLPCDPKVSLPAGARVVGAIVRGDANLQEQYWYDADVALALFHAEDHSKRRTRTTKGRYGLPIEVFTCQDRGNVGCFSDAGNLKQGFIFDYDYNKAGCAGAACPGDKDLVVTVLRQDEHFLYEATDVMRLNGGKTPGFVRSYKDENRVQITRTLDAIGRALSTSSYGSTVTESWYRCGGAPFPADAPAVCRGGDKIVNENNTLVANPHTGLNNPVWRRVIKLNDKVSRVFTYDPQSGALLGVHDGANGERLRMWVSYSAGGFPNAYSDGITSELITLTLDDRGLPTRMTVAALTDDQTLESYVIATNNDEQIAMVALDVQGGIRYDFLYNLFGELGTESVTGLGASSLVQGESFTPAGEPDAYILNQPVIDYTPDSALAEYPVCTGVL